MTVPLPDDALNLLQQVCEIGAPTGREAARARFIQQWFDAITPGSALLDEEGNVTVDPGVTDSPLWLLDAHIDTVSEHETLTVRKDGPIWFCPGAFDNTVTAVLLMLLAREFLLAAKPASFLFSFTTGEEGVGDLRGIRGVMKREGSRLRGGFGFDLRLDSVTTTAIGSERFRCHWRGGGGHSWKDFGTSSAIEALAEWIGTLPALADWKNGLLTYNVGEITGGTGVNVIAAEATASLDLRSSDPVLLAAVVPQVQEAARRVAEKNRVEVHFDPIGSRPAGRVPADWIGLHLLREVHAELGLDWKEQANSTNANAILEAGVPGTCTGLAMGGDIHTPQEWLDTRSLEKGWCKLQRLADKLLHAPK